MMKTVCASIEFVNSFVLSSLLFLLCVLFWTNYYVYFICTNFAGQVKEKKGRGYDKPTWGKSGKEYIEFTKDGLCLVPKDAKLSRFLGSLARTSNLLPLKPQDWRVIDNKDNTIEEVWRIIHVSNTT